jgi:hypothetical protein
MQIGSEARSCKVLLSLRSCRPFACAARPPTRPPAQRRHRVPNCAQCLPCPAGAACPALLVHCLRAQGNAHLHEGVDGCLSHELSLQPLDQQVGGGAALDHAQGHPLRQLQQAEGHGGRGAGATAGGWCRWAGIGGLHVCCVLLGSAETGHASDAQCGAVWCSTLRYTALHPPSWSG